MTEMNISRFKATCLAVLAEVRRTGVPVRIPHREKPIAEIVPPRAVSQKPWLGWMSDSIEISGDVVGPVGAFEAWGRVPR
jgi:antitoxin (DNA-binding transcriptional repressor) of toxin-antitoxin stability system